MIFEYAIEQKNKTIVHVDDVKNGKKCNCICKHCGDLLLAKNNGKIKKHHFCHTTKEESRSCLMTQLHLAMQVYFSSLNNIVLPGNKITIDGNEILVPTKKVEINKSTIEYRIGSYLADVLIITTDRDIVIEVCVTHKCEENKEDYYIENKIDSIEYYFSLEENNSISEWIERLEQNKVGYKWIYHNDLEVKKQQYFNEIEATNRKLFIKRRKSAIKSINKLLSKNKIHLPSITTPVEFTQGEYFFLEERLIYTKKDIPCPTIAIVEERDDSIILEGKIKERVISIIYSLSDSIPELHVDDHRSIICRFYPEESKNPKWIWVKHPPLTRAVNHAKSQFIIECQYRINAREQLITLKNKIYHYSSEYIDSAKTLFSRDYSTWKQWMIRNKLFTPTPEKKNPTYPDIFKMQKAHPSLWPFHVWSILCLSYLAEIIDSFPAYNEIYYIEVFDHLAKKIALSEHFQELSLQFKSINQSTTFDHLIDEKSIIRSVLSPFSANMLILFHDDYFITKGALVPHLKIN